MERRYPHLSSPITLGRVTFRNRMFSSPMGGTDITENGCIGPGSRAFSLRAVCRHIYDRQEQEG